MHELPSNWCPTGLQKASKHLKGASKGIAALTSELAHGSLATRLNGGGRAPDGARGTPYSPWLAQPFLKVRPACSHHHVARRNQWLWLQCFLGMASGPKISEETHITASSAHLLGAWARRYGMLSGMVATEMVSSMWSTHFALSGRRHGRVLVMRKRRE